MGKLVEIGGDAMPNIRAMVKKAGQLPRLMTNMAMGVETLFKRHFRGQKSIKNKLGGKSTGFWARAARNTAAYAGHAGIEVPEPAKGVALQVFGGTVTARAKSALTIPISPLAHGRSTQEADFKDRLFKLKSKKGNTILAMKGSGDDIIPMFVLKKSATIRGNRQLMPSDEAITDQIGKEIDRYFAFTLS